MSLRELDLDGEIIDFIGPEGSGKSTAAEKLSKVSGKPYVSVGDILRYMAKKDETELGRECRAMFEEHRYMEPTTLLRILEEFFKKEEFANGFILDGGLRTVEETAGFWEMLGKAGRQMPVTVVHLRVPGWIGASRLLGLNGLKGRKRDDDTVKGVLSRMGNFYKDLGERARLIREQEGFLLLHVNATGSVEETFEKVCKALGERVR